MNMFKPISLIHSPFSTNNSENNHEGTMNRFVITNRYILCFIGPPYHSKDYIFLKVALIPKIPPIHANTEEVCTKLNHGPTT